MVLRLVDKQSQFGHGQRHRRAVDNLPGCLVGGRLELRKVVCDQLRGGVACTLLVPVRTTQNDLVSAGLGRGQQNVLALRDARSSQLFAIPKIPKEKILLQKCLV